MFYKMEEGIHMTIVDLLDRNARLYPEEEALVEINPENHPSRTTTWREYNLIETAEGEKYRRAITWRQFEQSAPYQRDQKRRQSSHSSDE